MRGRAGPIGVAITLPLRTPAGNAQYRQARYDAGEGAAMRAVVLPIVVLLGAAPAFGLELEGRYGYAGEWAVSAMLTEGTFPGLWRKREFAGPVRLKHLAICGPGEVSEKTGTLRLSRTGASYVAKLVVGEDSCEVAGVLNEDRVAFADCGRSGKIPLRLWSK
jgi:hypothetical protein